VVSAYEAVLSLKPDYHEAALYMVEILGAPEDMGGDHAKAEIQTAELEKADKICGAKARELLLAEDISRVEFWQQKLAEHPGNAEVLEQLGKAYLYAEDPENGMKYLEMAMERDPSKMQLHLDMARYYFMTSRMDPEKAQTNLPKAETAINKFLKTEPIIPLKAYAFNMLSWVKQGLKQEEESAQLREKALALDHNVSQASAVPGAILFEKPDVISTYHSYFSRPF
jgi:tetratricopeptide (TPR) repeat protein